MLEAGSQLPTLNNVKTVPVTVRGATWAQMPNVNPIWGGLLSIWVGSGLSFDARVEFEPGSGSNIQI